MSNNGSRVFTANRIERSNSPWLVPLALVPGFVFMVAFVARSAYSSGQWRWTLFDDALISFAYGRTLAETGDWVWFSGADRVQGITNPLWSAFMALPHLAVSTPTGAIIVMTISTVVLMLALAIVVYRTLLSAGAAKAAALAAMGSVPFLYPLTFWTLRGMEVGFIALLSVLMLLSVINIQDPITESRAPWFVLAGISGIAVVLTRLDAIVIAATLAGVGFLLGHQQVRRTWLLLLATLLIAVGLVLVFQYFYWGDYLPNTYRLKVDGIPIDERLTRGLFATARALPLIALTGLAWHRIRRQSASPALTAGVGGASAVTAAVIAYSVWTGGDAWEWSLMLNRTVSVGLPLALIAWMLAMRSPSRIPLVGLLILGASGVGLGATVNPLGIDVRLAVIGTALTSAAAFLVWLALRADARPAVRSLLLALGFVVATSSPGAVLWVPYGGLNVQEDQRFALRAEELTRVTDEQATIAVMWAGAPGYFSDRSMIDMFGKSDRVIAQLPPRIDPVTGNPFEFVPGHNKWDYEHSVRDLRPDVVFQLGDDRSVAEADILEWGYQRGCLADGWLSYFRIDSPYVRWDELTPC